MSQVFDFWPLTRSSQWDDITAAPSRNGFRTLGFALAVATSFYVYFWYRNRRRAEDALAEQYGCKPVLARVPYRWPLALDLLKRQYDIFLSSRTFERMTEYFDIAPTCCIGLFGITGYFTTDPANIETILSTKFDDYGLGSRRLASAPVLGEGIFSQDGAPWKHSRELIRRQFTRVQKQTLRAFLPHVDGLIAALREATSAGSMVDMKPHFFEYTLNTTTQLLFGEPHSNLPKEERDTIRDNFGYATLGMGIRVRLADLAPIYNPPKLKKASKSVRDWAAIFVRKALQYKDEVGEEQAINRYPFILELWRDIKDENLVRDQLLHILIAGRDSTALLLSWSFFHLVRNPDVLERLRGEVAKLPAGSEITREQIQQLPFLRCCLNEILRLYPSLPMNIRFTNKPTVLPRGGGPDGSSPTLLPKGAGIAWSVYHLHRSKTIYGPDSRVYRPSRWEDGELIKKARPGAGFVDFNGGPRTCLGKDFAIMEASYAIIRILQAFPTIQLPPGVPNEPVGHEEHNYTITLEPAEGVKVLLG